jgi:hypothetical protein
MPGGRCASLCFAELCWIDQGAIRVVSRTLRNPRQIDPTRRWSSIPRHGGLYFLSLDPGLSAPVPSR